MSVLAKAWGQDIKFHRNNMWWRALIDAAHEIGMVVACEKDVCQAGCHDGPTQAVCDCDSGLAGIPVAKVRGGSDYVVTTREIRAALDTHDRWTGDLTSIVVTQVAPLRDASANEAPSDGNGPFVDAPLGEDGAKDFRAFVDFLRAAEPYDIWID